MSRAEEMFGCIRAGDRRALARGLSAIEAADADGVALARLAFLNSGSAIRIGITGAPGVGKSTLLDALTPMLADRVGRVGVLAVDPSSAFTQGALLGDRVRMTRATADDRIFVRSVASRGTLGGLSPHALEAADLLDAAGFGAVILETVGVGQSEIDVVFAVDVAVVLLAPGAGDGIQALKAGLMEAGDVFCINKCDLDGADALMTDVQSALDVGVAREPSPTVVAVSARSGKGLEHLDAAIWRIVEAQRAGTGWDRRRRDVLVRRVASDAAREAASAISRRLLASPDLLERLIARQVDPPGALAALQRKHS